VEKGYMAPLFQVAQPVVMKQDFGCQPFPTDALIPPEMSSTGGNRLRARGGVAPPPRGTGALEFGLVPGYLSAYPRLFRRDPR
jgi:hypothetical protein